MRKTVGKKIVFIIIGAAAAVAACFVWRAAVEDNSGDAARFAEEYGQVGRDNVFVYKVWTRFWNS